MKMILPLSAALVVAAPAAAQSSHDAHHPAGKGAPAMAGNADCPQKMQEMSGNMQHMMQMHQQMMGQMSEMMQMMHSMQQQHQGMGMTMPKSSPPRADKPR